MTETEKRRIELLSQTRNLYREQGSIPAIHPRYRATYQKVYGAEHEKMPKGSLHIRMFIAMLIFVLYAGLDYNELELYQYHSDEIISVISQSIVVQGSENIEENITTSDEIEEELLIQEEIDIENSL